jgi:chromosome segregation ATPase
LQVLLILIKEDLQMDAVFLNERVQTLQVELQKSKQNLQDCTERLEQAKAHVNMVSGHLNEAAYLMQQAQAKEAGQKAAMDALEHKEEKNGDANEQDAQ